MTEMQQWHDEQNAQAYAARLAQTHYDRCVRRAAGTIRRVEREGYGRNGEATAAGIRRYLREAQRIAVHDLPADAARAAKFGELMDRADAIGAGL